MLNFRAQLKELKEYNMYIRGVQFNFNVARSIKEKYINLENRIKKSHNLIFEEYINLTNKNMELERKIMILEQEKIDLQDKLNQPGYNKKEVNQEEEEKKNKEMLDKSRLDHIEEDNASLRLMLTSLTKPFLMSALRSNNHEQINIVFRTMGINVNDMMDVAGGHKFRHIFHLSKNKI